MYLSSPWLVASYPVEGDLNSLQASLGESCILRVGIFAMTNHRESLHDFDSARRNEFVERILAFITRQSLDLLPFDQVREKLRLRDRHY